MIVSLDDGPLSGNSIERDGLSVTSLSSAKEDSANFEDIPLTDSQNINAESSEMNGNTAGKNGVRKESKVNKNGDVINYDDSKIETLFNIDLSLEKVRKYLDFFY